MLINLLTPLIIASAPNAVIIDANFSYSHETQTRYLQATGSPSEESWTFNGTQTFDYNGRPADADND